MASGGPIEQPKKLKNMSKATSDTEPRHKKIRVTEFAEEDPCGYMVAQILRKNHLQAKW